MTIQIQHDQSVDALYIEFNVRLVAYTDDISRHGYYERGIDYAADGTPVGVEFLNVSRGVDLTGVPHADEIARLLSEHNFRILVEG